MAKLPSEVIPAVYIELHLPLPLPAAGPAQPSSAFSVLANLIEGNDLSSRFSLARLLQERSSVFSHRTAPSGTVRIQQGKVQGGLGARRPLGVRVEVDISELALGAWGTQGGHLWQRDGPEQGLKGHLISPGPRTALFSAVSALLPESYSPARMLPLLPLAP